MSQAVINLKGAKRILSEKSRWNRGFLAADDEGEDVSPLSDEAVCFCAIGAMVKSAYTYDPDLVPENTPSSHTFEGWVSGVKGFEFLVDSMSTLSGDLDAGTIGTVWTVNDKLQRSGEHSTFLKLFDDAIKLAEAEDVAS